jgi:hypothetical protein
VLQVLKIPIPAHFVPAGSPVPPAPLNERFAKNHRQISHSTVQGRLGQACGMSCIGITAMARETDKRAHLAHGDLRRANMRPGGIKPGDQQSSGGRCDHAGGQALKQCRAQLRLQSGDGLRDRWLGEADRVSGRADTAQTGNVHRRPGVTQIEFPDIHMAGLAKTYASCIVSTLPRRHAPP